MDTTERVPNPPKLSEVFHFLTLDDETGDYICRYHSITFDPKHKDVSFEELRLSDHQEGTKPMTNLPLASVVLSGHQQNVWKIWKRPSLRRDRDSIMHINSPVVRVKVGSDLSNQHEFSIHKDILIRSSDFFKTAIKKIWLDIETEELSPMVEMLDDDPSNFSIYADWLYSGVIFSVNEASTKYNDTEFDELVLAYILGEKVLDKPFKNAVIDALIEKFLIELVIDLELSQLVYNNTPPGSPLRRLLVDIYAYHAAPQWMKASSANGTLDSRFVFDLSLAQVANRNLETKTPPYLQSSCFYHEHEGLFEKCARNSGGKNYHPRRILN